MNLLSPLTVAIPFVVAAVLMAFPRTSRRLVVDVVSIVAAASVAVVAAWMLSSYPKPVIHWFGDWKIRSGTVIGITFFADAIGVILTCFAATVVCAALAASWRYFDAVGSLYHSLLLVLLGGLAGFCLTGDLFNLFVWYELAGVAAYALTAYKIEEAGPLQGGVNFAVTVTLGASFFLMGVALLYGRTGVLNMVEMGSILADSPPDALLLASFVLVTAGLLIKSAILPFHFAHADAHAVAPTPVLVVFSGFLLYVGLYGFARVFWTVFSGVAAQDIYPFQVILLGAGSATALTGAIMSLIQNHLKRLFAFISISHGGVILIGIAVFDPTALAGSFLYLISHGSVMASFFVLIGLLLQRYSEVHEHRLHGRASKLRGPGLLFAAAALGVAGVPPFGTFFGKSLIEEAAAHAGFGWVGLVIIAAAALTGAAAFRAGARIFAGWGEIREEEEEEEERQEGQAEEQEAETEGPAGRASLVMLLPAVGLLMLCLALGIFEAPMRLLHAASVAFQDFEFYRTSVLGSGLSEAPPLTDVAIKMRPALVKTGFTVLAALVIASAAIFATRLPDSLQHAARTAEFPMKIIRRWHSGHVGDYVMWMTVGIAVFGAILFAMVLGS